MRLSHPIALLPLLLLLLFSLLSSSSAQTFPSTFPTAYSASVSMNFGTLNYSLSFDEYAQYNVYNINGAITGRQVVQQRGRYQDRNTWTFLDFSNGLPSFFEVATVNGDPTLITSCNSTVLFEDAGDFVYSSLSTGPSLGVFGYVLPHLQGVTWTSSEGVRLTDRNMPTTLWTMSTPLTITPVSKRSIVTYTVSGGSTSAPYPPSGDSPAYYPLAELVDMNLRFAEFAGLVYQSNISSIQVYLSSSTMTFPDNVAYNIPVRLVVNGTRVLWDGVDMSGPVTDASVTSFTNVFDWAAVQPVQLRYYNPTALNATCTLLDEHWLPPAIISPSILATPPILLAHPPLTAFPPSFQATMEALTSLPPPGQPGLNAPLVLSQFRENTPNADGTVVWDENNQVIQLINAPTANYGDWYQYNHTITGGGSHWQLTSSPAASPPFSCSWQWLYGGNRSPIDYIHEQQLSKIYSMTNGSIYLGLWGYNHSEYARGVWCDVYLMYNVTAASRTDGRYYSWVQSLYVTATGWQTQGRVNSNVSGSADAGLPVMIVTTGYSTLGSSAYNFTDYVHFFTLYANPNPFIFNPQGYGCQPAPKVSGGRPLFPALSAMPSSYSSTITFSAFTLSAGNVSQQPVTWSYTEYYQASPPLMRVDGDTESINSVQVFNLLTNVSTLATNPALDLGALGYASYPDYATHPSTSNIGSASAAQCRQFTATPAQASSVWFSSTLSFATGLLGVNQNTAQYMGVTAADPLETSWVSNYRLVVPVSGTSDALVYLGVGVYTFANAVALSSAGAVRPVNFTYALNVTDLGVIASASLVSYTSTSVTFSQLQDFSASPMPAGVFAQPTGCTTDTYQSRYAQALVAVSTNLSYPGVQPTTPVLATAGGSFSVHLLFPLNAANGDARLYDVQWRYQASGPQMERVDWALADTADPQFASSRSSYIHVWSNGIIVPTGSAQAEFIYSGYGVGGNCSGQPFSPAASVLQSFAQGAVWNLFAAPASTSPFTAVQVTQPVVMNGIPCWPYQMSSGGMAYFAVPGWTFFARNSIGSLVAFTGTVSVNGVQTPYTVNVLAYDAEAPSVGAFAPLWSATFSPTCATGDCSNLVAISGLAAPNPTCSGSSTGGANGGSSSTGAAPVVLFDFGGLTSGEKLAVGLILGLFLPLAICLVVCWCRRSGKGFTSSSSSSQDGRRPQRFHDDRHTLDLDEAPMDLNAPGYEDEHVASVVRSLSKQRSPTNGNGRTAAAAADADTDEVRMEDVELSEDGESDASVDGRKSGKKKKSKGGKSGKKKKKSHRSPKSDDSDAIEMGGI